MSHFAPWRDRALSSSSAGWARSPALSSSALRLQLCSLLLCFWSPACRAQCGAWSRMDGNASGMRGLGDKWESVRGTKSQAQIPLLKDPDCAATVDGSWMWYCPASGIEFVQQSMAWRSDFSILLDVFQKIDAVYQRPLSMLCVSPSSSPGFSKAQIAPPFFIQTQTLARMIRWASSMGKRSADHWETQFAGKIVHLFSWLLLWEHLEPELSSGFWGSFSSISALWWLQWFLHEIQVHRHCKPSLTNWLRREGRVV